MPVNLYETLQRPLTIAEVDANMQIVQTAVDNQAAAIAAAVATAGDRVAVAADVQISAEQVVLAQAAAADAAGQIMTVANNLIITQTMLVEHFAFA